MLLFWDLTYTWGLISDLIQLFKVGNRVKTFNDIRYDASMITKCDEV